MTDRVHVLPGSFNVRDLGGLATADGRSVRAGAVFRSDYPAFAEREDGADVRRLGLRTVVDLRRGTEAAVERVPWEDHGVAYHRCPITAFEKSSWEARYAAYLQDRPETVVEAVELVLSPANHPVLFHCAAGKDRTGLVAALVLSVLGVPEEEIVADYALSADSVVHIVGRLNGIDLYRELFGELDADAQHPHPEHMEGLLAWLRAYGGAERWLLDHGLGADRIAAARSALLE
ncbi:tyrosine-protein phosphatase [Nocardioides mangrovi]|uniref:Tyrosine-protein phosphatase n=1 Tax=Nocardioides mangrovi TaxID=2874580 RepID=A0ABS7UC06_9ACTN|nr:tyrosine-protein phosphatase [Nocardioides mangrovi]MBZ5738374.1 tyrosine-protein phosphatase [Nocardioides mangrovi]